MKGTLFLQLKNAAAEARKEGKRDMRSSHLPLITAEYELLREEILQDAKVLTKVKLLSTEEQLQKFLGTPSTQAAAISREEQADPSNGTE